MGMNFQDSWRRLRAAAWLGWQIESNWTDPFLFIVHALAKPLATGLILLAMYFVVIGGNVGDERLAWMYVGNAFFTFVPLLLVGVGWAVVEDREIYQMLKYVYIAPIGLFTFLAGRSLTKLLISLIACATLLLVGAIFLKLPYHLTLESLGFGLVAFLFGVLTIFGLGLVLGGFGLVFARHSVNLNEGAAALLYLLCGAIFPIQLLPGVLKILALAIPITWWLAAMRRGLGIGGSSAPFVSMSNAELLGGLAILSIATYIFGAMTYRLLEHRAKQLGLIDQTTIF